MSIIPQFFKKLQNIMRQGPTGGTTKATHRHKPKTKTHRPKKVIKNNKAMKNTIIEIKAWRTEIHKELPQTNKRTLATGNNQGKRQMKCTFCRRGSTCG